MRRLLLICSLILFLAVPAGAVEYSAPEAPEAAQKYMPDETESFGEGLWYIITSALETLQPGMAESVRICVSLIAAALTAGLVSEFSGNTRPVVSLIGTIITGMLLFQPVDSMIELGIRTVEQISQYGQLLLPVMTGALAAQGSVSKASAVYAATVFFDALLSSAVSRLLIPLLYIYLCLSLVCNLFSQPLMEQMRKFIKWMITWGLKVVLYVFTGYISITGVVSGTTDAAAVKATKLTISGMVPVVGSILSDASEAVLVSAGIMKNAVGIYGLFAVIALWIGPFLQTGIQYLMLKVTVGITQMFGPKQMAGLIKDFSSAMGLVLAMTGTVCLIFLISIICYMKGVG